VVPLPKTAVTITPPAWLKATVGFEITPQGLRDLDWKSDAGQLVINLGQTDVARLVLFTADPWLRRQLDELYRDRFATNVARLNAVRTR
jgi:hypothetical protein